MATWVEDLERALVNLGGVATLEEIYREILKIRTETIPSEYEAVIRERLERNSRGNGSDLFRSVDGIGKGVWGLRDPIAHSDQAVDVTPPGDEEATRILLETYRIVRDTPLTRALKLLHKHECQICGDTIELPRGRYSEAHHIKPLGSPHSGPDIENNILILCPNHHVLCDFGGIELSLGKIRLHPQHTISEQFVNYHNQLIFRGRIQEI